MKEYLFPSLKLTVVMIIICAVLYPLLIAGIARFAPGGGGGEKLTLNGKVVGYANIGQKFTADKYFWGRPSAVDYNAAGSGGSNKGPSDPGYLKVVEDRIALFLVHNPSTKKEQVPAEMVTASGSGLDPDITPEAALIQAERVARARGISTSTIIQLIRRGTNKPFLGILGTPHINVLALNIELDKLQKNGQR